jgi:hypothetical protein
MELTVVLNLPDELYSELVTASRIAHCSPTQFAVESVHSTLASRRLPRVEVGSHGPRISAVDADGPGYRVNVEDTY